MAWWIVSGISHCLRSCPFLSSSPRSVPKSRVSRAKIHGSLPVHSTPPTVPGFQPLSAGGGGVFLYNSRRWSGYYRELMPSGVWEDGGVCLFSCYWHPFLQLQPTAPLELQLYSTLMLCCSVKGVGRTVLLLSFCSTPVAWFGLEDLS